MFGVAKDQIARINAVNVGDPEIRPIRVELGFVDASGAVVARDTKTIAPGEATFFDFKFDTSLEVNRQELRALISAQSPPDPDKNLKISDREAGGNWCRCSS
jgi:hypothetical protein